MTSLISKADIELEMRSVLPAAYTDIIIAGMSSEAEDIVKMDTHRTAFTGLSASAYKRAVLITIVRRISTSDPSLSQGNIQSLSEQGDSVTYRGSVGTDSYISEYAALVRKLALRSHSVSNAVTNDSTFYRR